MEQDTKERAEKLANEHWKWFQELVGQIVIDFFIHGYKHGDDERGEKVKPQKEG